MNSLREACRNGVNRLFPERKNVADGERALEKFREKQGLDRPAVYPESRSRIFGIIFFLFTLEIALNAYTLGSAHPDGPLGVVLETFMIAALNIAIGVTTGWLFWREICHRNALRRLFGLAATGSLTIVTLAGNLAVGHYRDAILTTSARAQELGVMGFITAFDKLGEAVQASLLTNPFALHDFKSYLTIFVGIALSLYAAKEGFATDDRHPGYGRISRDQEERGGNYSKLFAYLQSELIGIDEQAIKEIGPIAQLADIQQAARQDHVDTSQMLISAFSDWTEEISSLGATLYAKYREANEQHRTASRPPCFDIDFAFPPDLAMPPNFPAAIPVERTTNLNALISQCSTKINFALNEYLSVYQTIGALAPEDLTKERATTFDVKVERIYHQITAGIDDA